MKIYLHTDLEGVSGIVDLDTIVIPEGRGMMYTKELLTEEVNAVIRGIRKVDAEAEIVVQDGHCGGWWGPNIIVEKLESNAKIIHGKRGSEVVGLDSSFDLLMFIGAHSMAGTRNGLLCHTIALDRIHNIFVNGKPYGEIGLVAAFAGQHGVPVGLVSGDYWAVIEAQELLGTIEGVVVKKGINFNTAECLSPTVTKRMLEDSAVKAVSRVKDFQPLTTGNSIELKIEYIKTSDADNAERRGATRFDGRTVVFKGNNILDVIDCIF